MVTSTARPLRATCNMHLANRLRPMQHKITGSARPRPGWRLLWFHHTDCTFMPPVHNPRPTSGLTQLSATHISHGPHHDGSSTCIQPCKEEMGRLKQELSAVGWALTRWSSCWCKLPPMPLVPQMMQMMQMMPRQETNTA